MDSRGISEAIAGVLQERGCFPVEVKVSRDNDVAIFIEKEEGDVDWDDCAAVDAAVHAAFNQDEEDYSLTVSSAGLDRPFKVLRQFQKAIGTKVDVKLRGGKRLVATLAEASEDHIVLEYTALETPPDGKKKKQKVSRRDTLSMTEVNSVTPFIEIND